jgi:hypothetical protein
MGGQDNALSLNMSYQMNVQWKPLNVITLGPRETDSFHTMITENKLTTYKIGIWGRTNMVNLITLTK